MKGCARPARVPTLLAVAVITTGCGPGPLDPARTGGERIPGTEGAAYLGGRPFSVSPDHRWLLFARDVQRGDGPGGSDDAGRSDAAASSFDDDRIEGQIARIRAYRLRDLETGVATSPEVSTEVVDLVRSSGGILLDGGCWVGTGDGIRVVVRDPFGRSIGLDPTDPDLTWVVVDLDRSDYADACPREDLHLPPPGPRGPFVVQGSGTRTLTIRDVDDPDRVYAVHRAGATSTHVQISRVALSPDGRRLAYVVTPAMGSFVANPRAFVIGADSDGGAPHPLAAPVYGLRWAPDGSALYAAVREEGGLSIYRWGSPTER